MKISNLFLFLLAFSLFSCSSKEPDPIILIEKKDPKLTVFSVEGSIVDSAGNPVQNVDVNTRTSSYQEDKNTGWGGNFITEVKMFPEEPVTFTFKSPRQGIDAIVRNKSFPKGTDKIIVKFLLVTPGRVVIKEMLY